MLPAVGLAAAEAPDAAGLAEAPEAAGFAAAEAEAAGLAEAALAAGAALEGLAATEAGVEGAAAELAGADVPPPQAASATDRPSSNDPSSFVLIGCKGTACLLRRGKTRPASRYDGQMSGVYRHQQPPAIFWGAGSLARLSEELDAVGVKRPYLVSTRSVEGNEGLMSHLRKALGRELVGIAEPVSQHAPQADVDAALEAARQAQPDGIVSFGGGSPIDAAKIVAADLGHLPHVAVPTTLSVAELGPSAGVTDERGRKGGRLGTDLLPQAVIYDAELSLRTPLDLWLATGIRAVDHGVESLLEPGDHPYADTLALEGLRRLFVSLPAAKARPGDLEARTQNELGAWFAYSLPRAAVGLSHMLGKLIGSPFGIPHGVTSCLLLPHVMRYLAATQADRLALMAPALGVNRPGASEAELARAAADAVEGLIARLGLPHHLAAYGLSEEQLRGAAEGLSKQYPVEDLLAILHAAA